MGREGSVDLAGVLRADEKNERLEELIRATVFAKVSGHNFELAETSIKGIKRNMSELGG